MTRVAACCGYSFLYLEPFFRANQEQERRILQRIVAK